MLTASSLFLRSLSEFGITHAFVNWGSDHPAILEELQRQRVHDGKTALEIITCPNEMVALSAAQGFAQVTRKPAAVLIHVDVGTQALAGAINNVDRCRTPVLIYAGASPFSQDGELKGSRNEYIMWYQDVPDQAAIVRQYMRYTNQICSGKNVRQVVGRALLSAMSEPKGPVYLWARREIMEEEMLESDMTSSPTQHILSPIEPTALSANTAKTIADMLFQAKSPLIITSYIGRNPAAVQKLVDLSETMAIPVYLSCPTTVNFPGTHPHLVGISIGNDKNEWLRNADVVLIIDSDIPYIPVHNKPMANAKIIHIDVDVLKDGMGMFYVDACLRCKVDAETALDQVLSNLRFKYTRDELIAGRARKISDYGVKRIADMNALEQYHLDTHRVSILTLCYTLRELLPQKTLILNESTTLLPTVWAHMRAKEPGSMLTSGSSSLGWGLGAAIGASLGNAAGNVGHEFIVLIVGDGSYVFGVPSAAFWIARRYNTPFLTIVLNNGGWNAPRMSMLSLHPQGLGSQASLDTLSVGFGPDVPDYANIAVAAGGAWGAKIRSFDDMWETLTKAIEVVKEEKRCAVVEFTSR